MRRIRLILAVGLFLAATHIAAAARDLHVYVIYGQGGRLMSRGMESLAQSLRKMDPRVEVSTYHWDRYKDVAKKIRELPPDAPVAVIGYSLGANATTWIANAVRSRTIDLIVAYDPTKWSEVQAIGGNVKRVLLYHNNGPDPFGHARINGRQVETVETRNSHLSIDDSSWLHDKTRAAIAELLGQL